jgi:hypothetical protein
MLLQIPNIFLVADCKNCRTRHAPIRDCPDSKGTMMYFDAVLLDGSRIVLFNGTPDETLEYVLSLNMPDREKVHVMDGKTLSYYTAQEYIDR